MDARRARRARVELGLAWMYRAKSTACNPSALTTRTWSTGLRAGCAQMAAAIRAAMRVLVNEGIAGTLVFYQPAPKPEMNALRTPVHPGFRFPGLELPTAQ